MMVLDHYGDDQGQDFKQPNQTGQRDDMKIVSTHAINMIQSITGTC